MMRYRVLLVDTEAVQERPIQTFCMGMATVNSWARRVLSTAHKHAYVVIYHTDEVELGTIKKSDYDESPTAVLQPASAQTGQ